MGRSGFGGEVWFEAADIAGNLFHIEAAVENSKTVAAENRDLAKVDQSEKTGRQISLAIARSKFTINFHKRSAFLRPKTRHS